MSKATRKFARHEAATRAARRWKTGLSEDAVVSALWTLAGTVTIDATLVYAGSAAHLLEDPSRRVEAVYAT